MLELPDGVRLQSSFLFSKNEDIFPERKNMKKIISALALVPVFFSAANAFASSTLSYSCQATVHEPASTTVWFYELRGIATAGSEGFVGFQKAPMLSVSKSLSAASPTDVTKVLVQDEALNEDGYDHKADHQVLLMSLKRSVLGLRVYLDTTTNEIFVRHVVAPGKVIESQKGALCQVDEIG